MNELYEYGSWSPPNKRRSPDIHSSEETDDRGWTPLHVAARKGDVREVKRLLKEGMDANVATKGPRSVGVTPLHLAAKGGHVRVMDKLLEHGADIDAKTKGACGWTPLHNASRERKKRAVRFLIENGAFLADDMFDSRFNPPLYYCPGLEFAYEEKRRFEEETTSSSDETCSSYESLMLYREMVSRCTGW